MLQILKIVSQNPIRRITRRFICNGRKLLAPSTYEGDGKTKMNILNSETELGLMINGYSEAGFRLSNEVTVLGPMVIFPRSVLSWNIANFSDITEESLSLFKVLEPKIDIVVLGIGDKAKDFNNFRTVVAFSRKYKIPFEILPTSAACSTFNFLSSEGRYVAGAFIPPTIIDYNEDDEISSKLRYQNLYKLED